MGDINIDEIVHKVKEEVGEVVGKAEEFIKSDGVQNFIKTAEEKAGDFAEKAKDVAVDVGGKIAQEAGELTDRAKEAYNDLKEKKKEEKSDNDAQ